MIDFNDLNTFPTATIKLIKEKSNSYSSFENYEEFKNSVFQLNRDEIEELLKESKFKAYHFSRVLNCNEILENGLKPLSLEFFDKNILPRILDLFDNKEKQTLLKLHEDFKIKNTFKNREDQISFTTDRNFSYADGGSRFWKTFGGEYALVLVNSAKIKAGVEKLGNIGTPYVFELEINYSEVNLLCTDQIIRKLIDLIYNTSITNNFPEGYIRKTILPKKAEKLL